MRKPLGMTARAWIGRAEELNSQLLQYPKDSNGLAIRTIPEDDRLDNYHFLTPNSWRKFMQVHGFDPLENSISDFIEFCEERIEGTDELGAKPKAKPIDNKRKPDGQHSHK